MASSSSIVYCTDQDIFDIYPRISQYDYKTKLLSRWSKAGSLYELNDFKFPDDEAGLVGGNRIIQLYVNGKDLGNPEEDVGQLNHTGEWFMQLNLTPPELFYYDSSNNPNNMIMELGEDRTNLMLRFRKKASRLVESFLGSAISREIMKDREGNYPTSIIQATALKTAILFISGYDPNNPDLIPLNEEYGDIMDKIKSGKIVMTGHRSENDSKGQIRIVTAGSIDNEVYPVELIGSYKGNDYELLKIKIKGSLLYPTSEEREDEDRELFYSVWGKSNTKLKETLLVDNKLVSGDFQTLGVSDLYIRWGFSEWKAGSGDVHGVEDSSDTPIPLKLASGVQGSLSVLSESILYTGIDGLSINYLYAQELLPNITAINSAYLWQGIWVNTFNLTNKDDDGEYTKYEVTTTAAQDEIMYDECVDNDAAVAPFDCAQAVANFGCEYDWVGTTIGEYCPVSCNTCSEGDLLPIWSNLTGGAEYEIELWGNNIQPTVSQINSISRGSRLWH